MILAAAVLASVVTVWVSGGPAALVLLTAMVVVAAAAAVRRWHERCARARRWRAFEAGFRVYAGDHGELGRRRG